MDQRPHAKGNSKISWTLLTNVMNWIVRANKVLCICVWFSKMPIENIYFFYSTQKNIVQMIEYCSLYVLSVEYTTQHLIIGRTIFDHFIYANFSKCCVCVVSAVFLPSLQSTDYNGQKKNPTTFYDFFFSFSVSCFIIQMNCWFPIRNHNFKFKICPAYEISHSHKCREKMNHKSASYTTKIR